MTARAAIERVREDLARQRQEPGFTDTRETFALQVQTGEALKRGVAADFTREIPDDLTLCGEPLPEELRYAVTYVEGRGWCLWATTTAGRTILPRDRDWHPLSDIAEWSRVGFAGVWVRLRD